MRYLILYHFYNSCLFLTLQKHKQLIPIRLHNVIGPKSVCRSILKRNTRADAVFIFDGTWRYPAVNLSTGLNDAKTLRVRN